MSRSAQHHDSTLDGIVIRSQAAGDADLILTVLCEIEGKRSFMAKQARKSRKRFGSSFDIFDTGRFEIKQGRGNLPLVTSYIPASSFRGLRDNLDRLMLASLLCEAFDALLLEESPGEEPFHALLIATLQALNDSGDVRGMLRSSYECIATLLELCGYLERSQLAAPSARGFIQLIQSTEQYAERKLRTKAGVIDIMKQFSRTENRRQAHQG